LGGGNQIALELAYYYFQPFKHLWLFDAMKKHKLDKDDLSHLTAAQAAALLILKEQASKMLVHAQKQAQQHKQESSTMTLPATSHATLFHH
jgi:hypothetical protein